MKIREFGDEVSFDDFPKLYHPKNKVFLTCLLNFDDLTLPTMLPKIYTTEILKTETLHFYRVKGIDRLNDSHIEVITPFVRFDLKLSSGAVYECLPCESKDTSRYLMLLFREKKATQGTRITHLYVGSFANIRSVVLEEEFAAWIQRSGVVENMYLYLKRSHVQGNPRMLEDAIAAIQLLVEEYNSTKLCITVPFFGYENFIAKLSSSFPHRVLLVGLECKPSLKNIKGFARSIQAANIVVTTKNIRPSKIQSDFNLESLIAVSFIDDVDMTNTSRVAYEIKWSPLPSDFDLKLLTQLVHAKAIHGIVNKHTMETHPSKELIKICRKNQSGKSNESSKRKNREEDGVFGSSPKVIQHSVDNKPASLSRSEEATAKALCSRLMQRKAFQYLDSESSSP